MVNVLIVDDEEDIRISLKMLVEDMGYKATTAENGIKALELLKKEKFDIVLLDILMPKMSGREVLENIRKDPKLKDQKVVFLTVVKLGLVGKDSIKNLKPTDYLQKPIKVAEFRERIKKIVGK